MNRVVCVGVRVGLQVHLCMRQVICRSARPVSAVTVVMKDYRERR